MVHAGKVSNEMRTYVDAKPCAVVKGQGGEFAAQGRYTIDVDHGLLLFSSNQEVHSLWARVAEDSAERPIYRARGGMCVPVSHRGTG